MPWGVGSYNSNPDLNNLINGIDIGEGADAEGYNNALRQIMADIAGWTATGLATLGGLPLIYRDLVFIQKNASFTFADSERAGALGYVGGAGTATINPQSTTPITLGAVYVVRNGGTGTLVVTKGAGVTLQANGATASANATMAIGSIATLINWGSDIWSINGSGLS